MHKQLLLLVALAMSLPYAGAAPMYAEPDEDGGWSWRDGLLGDNPDYGDIFDEDNFHPGVMCDECRDPHEHPMDFAAAAYNSHYGEDAWLRGSRLGIPFRIYNLKLQWVVVWFEGVAFDGISFLPNTMTIHVRLQDGRIVVFSVIQGGPDLPVGDPNPEPPVGSDNCSCGDEGGGGAGDDDYSDPDEGLPEPLDRWGRVVIEDPDENGEFPEWEL